MNPSEIIPIEKLKNKRLSLQELAVLAQQLASMLEANLPLLVCLESLTEQNSSNHIRSILYHVSREVYNGQQFSQALNKFPNAFPSFFLNMAKAGEASGNLSGAMRNAANYFDKMSKLFKKVKGALTYPIIIITMALILVNLLIVFVIPVFTDMFKSFDAKLPTPTLILINLSDFLNHYGIFIIVLLALIVLLVRRLFQTPKGRIIKDKIVHCFPIVGSLAHKLAVARFARTYSAMTESGIPILEAIKICADVSNNTYVESICQKMVTKVSQGGQISEVLAQSPYFPPLVKYMSQTGEKTGEIGPMMGKAADFYEAEVDTAIGSLTTVIEPILIVFLGLIIGALVMSLFLPIFELSSAIK